MGILTWIMMGIIIGILSELIMTDPGPGGTVFTILLGSAGAFISIGSLVLAVTGAVVLVTLSRVLKKK